MATAAAIAAAAIGAAGSIAGGVISSQGASKAAKAGRSGRGEAIPLPKYAAAINHILARATALNVGAVPPSFADYQASGGTATFPWQDPGITSVEKYKLGLVDRAGGDVPGGPDSSLSPEERLFLAQWFASRGRQGNPLYGLGQLGNRIDRIDAKPSTPKRERRLDDLRGKLEDRLSKRGQ